MASAEEYSQFYWPPFWGAAGTKVIQDGVSLGLMYPKPAGQQQGESSCHGASRLLCCK